MHLIVIEDHRAPQVFFQMIVDGAGGYYDPPSIARARHVHRASLMREGTTTKTSEQISEQLDRLAAVVGVAPASRRRSRPSRGNGLTNNLDTVLALMADVLMNPSFPQAEIDRYKTRTRAHFINQRTQPGFLAQERLSKALFGDHPLSRVSPTPAALDALTRDALVEFHKAHYVPDRAVLAVAGDISLDAGEEQGGRGVRRLEEVGRGDRGADRAVRSGAGDDLVRRAAEFGADEPARRHPEHRAHQP